MALWRVRGFCEIVLGDDGAFLLRYHEVRGDREICITPWHAHPDIGEVRDVKFLTNTKVGAFAFKSTSMSCQAQIYMVAVPDPEQLSCVQVFQLILPLQVPLVAHADYVLSRAQALTLTRVAGTEHSHGFDPALRP
jgi:hypothetical protein